MKIFLDENFPIHLLEELSDRGFDAIHVIPEGLRGSTDERILTLLQETPYLFLTKDDDFFDLDIGTCSLGK